MPVHDQGQIQKINEESVINSQQDIIDEQPVLAEENGQIPPMEMVEDRLDTADPLYLSKLEDKSQQIIDGEIIAASRLIKGERGALRTVTAQKREAFNKNLQDSRFAQSILSSIKNEEAEPLQQEEKSSQEKARDIEKIMFDIAKWDPQDFAYKSSKTFLNKEGFLEAYKKLLVAKDADGKLDELLLLYQNKSGICKRPKELSENAVKEIRAKIAVFQEIEKDYSEMLSIMSSPYYALLEEKDLQNELEAVSTKKLTALTQKQNIPAAFAAYIDKLKARKNRQDTSEGGSFFTQKTKTKALLNHYRKKFQVDSPIAELSRAMSEVKADTRWSGDSFKMKVIKKGIDKLEGLYRSNDKIELIRQYDWLTSVMDKYLETRDTNGGRNVERHRKVQKLMHLLKQQREKLAFENPEAEQSASLLDQKEVLNAASKEKSMQKIVQSLRIIYSQPMPAKEDEFNAVKQTLLDNYGALIEHYQKKEKEFCYFDKAKMNRLLATRNIKHLTKVRDRLASYQFSELRPDLNFKEWRDDFKETKVVDENYLSQHKDEKYVPASQVASRQEDGTKFLAQTLGAGNLFVFGQKAKYKDTVSIDDYEETIQQDVYLFNKNQGKTIEDAIQKAKDLKLPLMYSDDALRQLQTIQLIDFIMGQTNRNQDSFIVNFKLQNVENVDYMVITNVSVRDHADCLGKDSFEQMNKDRRGKSTRKLINENGTTNLSFYDNKVADRIIALSPDKMREYFKGMGFGDENCDLLKERLEKLQSALKKDCEKGGPRYDMEENDKDEMKKGTQTAYLAKNYKRDKTYLLSKYTYINSSLIRDIGKTDLDEAAQLSKPVDKELDSVKPLLAIWESLNKDLEKDGKGFAGEELKEESKKVITAISEFQQVNANAQSFIKLRMKLRDAVKIREPERYQALYKQIEKDLTNSGDLIEDKKDSQIKERMDKLLKETDSNIIQYHVRLKQRRLKNALKLINDRIAVLETMQNRGTYENEELAALQNYLNKLKPTAENGELVVPKNAKVKTYLDSQFHKGYKIKDEKDMTLFPEEPSILDVVQGGAGDCFFMASLASVVNADPSFIKRHMKDNGDGTVTVKFYKKSLLGKSDPIYVTVNKSTVYQKKKDGNWENAGAKGCFWVQIYEKAATVSGLAHSSGKPGEYESIGEGGMTDEALGWITGQDGISIYDFSKKMGTHVRSFDMDNKTIDPATGKVVFKEEFLQGTVKAIKDAIKEAQRDGDILTAGSYHELVGATGSGQNGEELRRGLAGGHAYSVLGIEQVDGKDYVRVRNPWGSGRVVYKKNELTGETVMVEGNRSMFTGSFLVEISTFVEHMSILNYIPKDALKKK